MNVTVKKLSQQLREIERRTIDDIRSRQTKQSFGGALKVDPNKVYINERDGRKAIASLRMRIR